MKYILENRNSVNDSELLKNNEWQKLTTDFRALALEMKKELETITN